MTRRTTSSIKITVDYLGWATRVTVFDEATGLHRAEDIEGHCGDEAVIEEVKQRLTDEIKEKRSHAGRRNGRCKTVVPKLASA